MDLRQHKRRPSRRDSANATILRHPFLFCSRTQVHCRRGMTSLIRESSSRPGPLSTSLRPQSAQPVQLALSLLPRLSAGRTSVTGGGGKGSGHQAVLQPVGQENDSKYPALRASISRSMPNRDFLRAAAFARLGSRNRASSQGRKCRRPRPTAARHLRKQNLRGVWPEASPLASQNESDLIHTLEILHHNLLIGIPGASSVQ